MLHILHAAGPDQNQQIHDVTGVDAGAQDGHAVFLGQTIHFLSQLGILSLGIRHFLGRGDDVDAALYDKLDLGEHVLGEGVGADHDDVCGTGLDDVLGRADDHVGTVALGGLDELIHGLADLGFPVHDTHDVHALFLQQHVGNTAAHGAQAPDDDFYVFHSKTVLLNFIENHNLPF